MADKPVGADLDAKITASVRDLCASLVKAVSASKIFPPHHESVTVLRRVLFAHLNDFLDRHGEMELEVKQSEFLFQGDAVHFEDNPLRSLPYFFHKDGLQKLAFLPGLKSEEFIRFLDVVRSVSLLPLDTGDIVDALWQEDFEHIRTVSPDEFIEAKLAGDEKKPREFEVDPARLFEGTLEFTPEDAEEIFRKTMDLARKSGQEATDPEAVIDPLDSNDVQFLEAMIEAERRASAEKHLPDLMFELLHLETRPEAFDRVLSDLRQEHRDKVVKGEFGQIVRFLNRMDDLREVLAVVSPDRAEKIGSFFEGIRSDAGPDTIREVAMDGRIGNFKSFFEYLGFLGPSVCPLAAELYEHVHEGQFRVESSGFFEDMAQRDFARLVGETQEDRPHFNKLAIELCGKTLNPACIPFLVKAVGWKDTEGKLKAIQGLGRFADDRARSKLLEFLDDPDEDVRLAALKAIGFRDDPVPGERLMAIASAPRFREKSKDEKEAVLFALAKSRTDAACAFLGRLLRKRSFLHKTTSTETRLAAVRALERMAGPAAAEVLRASRRLRPKIVRNEARAALRRLAGHQG